VPTGSGGWFPRSFLLTDIVGSVGLWERDAESMAQAVAHHDAMIGREVAAAGGVLVRSKGEGDSTFSVFANPAEAVAAAVAVQEAMAAEPWPLELPVRVRAGMHTGDAEPRDGDWYGPAVNRAARLRALADGGQTLVSGVAAGLVADRLPAAVRLLYRGRRVLRGIERPEEVWELVAADDARLDAPASARVGGLPLALTRFVGRGHDVERLTQLIHEERLVTLTGPGGCGKTRMAMEVAAQATGQGEVVWLAELAPLRDGGRVAQTVATAVGFEDGPDPPNKLLAQAELLVGILVLDNCEHLLDTCEALTARLLAAAPGLRVLATSREPLGLAGERVWPVTPLEVPHESVRDRNELAGVESVQLLMDRARAVRPDLQLNDGDVASVRRICRALDGLPLAIELAAGRLRSLSLADLATRLGNQPAVLARQRSTGGPEARHHSLRITVDWSYDLLDEKQRTLARRLSVFAGGFRLDAVEEVCGGDLDALDGIDELVAKSLVTFDGVTARYRLLEPLRQYLAARLEASGATETVRRAHAEWVAALCDRLGTRLLDDQRARSRRLGEESGNIDAALTWAREHDPALAVGIVGSLGQYWFYYDQASGRRWCDLVTEAAANVTPRARAKALLSAGMIGEKDPAGDRSVGRLREALAIYRAEEVRRGQATTLFWLGRALANSWVPGAYGEHAQEATQCLEESLELFTEQNDWIGAGWCRLWLSAQAFWNGDMDRAEQLSSQVLQDCGAVGARHPMGEALSDLAFFARRRGDNEAALEYLRDAAALHRDLDDPAQLAGSLVLLAAQEAAMGRATDALQHLAESSQLDEQIGRLGRSEKLAIAAVVHLARGHAATSASALGAYDAHPAWDTGWGRQGRGEGNSWLDELVHATRARLDPAEVAAATATARGKRLDHLMDELIVQPASSVRQVAVTP
jgi:predicted ATPase/class 3 adenylate cyclase